MLKVNKISSGYGKSQILYDLSFDVNQGEVVTLIGSNGAGKTTTLKTICGVIPATSGNVIFDGNDITNLTPKAIVNSGISMIPEGRQLFPDFSVQENLVIGAFKKEARHHLHDSIDYVLSIFPKLKDRIHQKASSLSGGEQQMVAIARGLMSKPRLLIFDEPSLGLSPLLVSQMFDIIQTISQSGITVLLVEQNVFHTLKVANRGYVIENGSIVIEGNSNELLHNPHIKEAYLGH
ncbi:ABC transporter ATP-binding protein [Pelistega europaea]|uniref:ABC transporter ATP-binding protein n=1 Tax=Pelistega europaea TaxID=106147 RepID=A0A7Y4LBD6_9BURK|nr:ABC transporter ATP-binding protein [Pelistega europaea]NOL50440.1 ABC transporter ATP-binding protein [Pelistega europaea]